jgi:Zn-dependent peptidase ImmA (M78 family)
VSAEQEGLERAVAFRSEHDLGAAQPLTDLVALIEEKQQIDVTVIDAGADEHGMTAYDPARSLVAMAVARTPHVMRQRSSLAHELAHVLFADYRDGQDARTWAGRDSAEIRADAFARHLLFPAAAARRIAETRTSVSEADLSALVQMFVVSPAIVAIQLASAQAIDEQTKAAWKNLPTLALAARHGWIDQYRALQVGSNTRRAPQRLLARATDGYIAGVLSLQAVARLRGVAVDVVLRDFSEAGIVPAAVEVQWSPTDGLGGAPVDLSDLDDDGITW